MIDRDHLLYSTHLIMMPDLTQAATFYPQVEQQGPILGLGLARDA